jgi:Sec7-like guanine-nucleotide exchange factor
MEALQLFMQDFDFAVDALDVALRKLLLVASLPKETQQIDRVMEAFAKRYNDCHPGLLKDQGMFNP